MHPTACDATRFVGPAVVIVRGEWLESAAMPKHSSHILALARKGAEHRYVELKSEIAALIKSFPDLATGKRRIRIDMSTEPAAMIDSRPRRRRKMSAAARRKISLAQKRRWAKQKRASQ